MEKLQRQMSAVLNLLKLTPFKILLFALLGMIMFFAMYSNVKPEKLDLSLFSVADKTIRSPITVEDRAQTEKKRKEAVDQVEDVYILKKEYTQNRVDLLNSIFDSVSEVDDEANKSIKPKEDGSLPDQGSPEVRLDSFKKKLTDNVTKNISDQSLLSILAAAKDELDIARDLSVTAVNNVMGKRIPADDVENAKKRVEEELKYTSLNTDLKDAVIELGRYAVIQNEFYDPAATDELRQQARDNVDPVKILEGQIIVEEGQLISRDMYKQLKLTGLLESENSILPFAGLGMLIFIILAALYFIFAEKETNDKSQKDLLIFSILFILSLLIMKLLSIFEEFNYTETGYLFPAAMGAMLVKLLIDERVAIFHTVALGICGSIIYNQGITGALNVTVAIYIVASGLSAVLFLRKHNQRDKILQAGLVVSLVNIFVLMALMFIRNTHLSGGEYGFYLLVASLSGISSAVLTIGLLPFFEAGFGFLSTMKLIELANPNHPLIRKILTEAPGTYHHSVMVANLAEAACEAVGADGLLARVGCYYHDIGKTKRPQFFIENQMNIENPHDHLPPLTSRDIIIAHAVDGAEMLRKHKLPKEIIDIAEQHHGTTLLKFFYYKAKQAEMEVKESDFRYPGPRAQTKETAIIGIADSVEAAVRSLSHPTSEQIESLVKNIISDRLQDGQLNECDLTLKELDKVAHSLCETLKGIFHSRIEYPEMTKQKVKEA
ncbi:HD family phosphohydrolase [Mesobacillus zeae]|uniref:HDIG domain-containing protein n=1 Tax=Mesobacillus zeae TaxID=1917180 RepID=A0A398B7X3_9BACI|nr:HD family phosphohydrolase [Mesobacillus zeae]RID83806.1 HDIG domain-containing protein [Mesobacillus zeae]